MKQPEDTKTIDLLQAEKRGRGRPRKADALTPAERARRYRLKCKAEGRQISGGLAVQYRDGQAITEKDNKVFLLQQEVAQLRRELESYQQFFEQRADLDHLAQRQFDDLRRQYGTAYTIAQQLLDARRQKKALDRGVLTKMIVAFEQLQP